MANELTADTMPTRFDRRHVLVLVPRNVALAGVSAILVSLAAPAFASQAEFCVRCSGPDQTYRCQVKGVGPQYSDAAKLFCVLTTTKTEGHAKCTATKDPNCQGVVKVYDYGGMPLKIIWALLDLATIIILGTGLYLWLVRARRPNMIPERMLEPAE